MANEEHLARLREGGNAWNRWRGTHCDTRPDLQGADLSVARLGEADLSYASLRGAVLIGANLTGARLGKADLGWTTFGAVDLSVVHGLDTVEHRGPSTIGIDTLYTSHGKIPEGFLRGAGVSDGMITYMKSLVGRPFEFYSCFISYNHTDKSFVRRLHDQLQGRGIAAGSTSTRCFQVMTSTSRSTRHQALE